MKRRLFALLAFFVVGSALSQSPARVHITTWNLEWFPNGSPHDATPEGQAQRIAAAADVLRSINPDVVLLQEVRDYDACNRLGESIAPGVSRRNLLCVQGTVPQRLGETASRDPIQISSAGGMVRTLEIHERR